MKIFLCALIVLALFQSCNNEYSSERISVIFDTDANNELDDQHALAYLLFSGNTFHVEGITVNTTYNGGNIKKHFAEAERVVTLCNYRDKVPLIKGANGNYKELSKSIHDTHFDGYRAVDFIIETAKKHTNEKLVIIAVGKLTNIALAVKKDSSILPNIRLVWLGSNYPEPGEYNMENDIESMNYLLKSDIEFEMVVCRYGKETGTDAIRVTQEEMNTQMANLGPQISAPISGRHGGLFHNFGDYSVSLFKNAHYYGTPPSRALFDMACVAIVKNPEWAKPAIINCPIFIDNAWDQSPTSKRQITIWEHFDAYRIKNDFFNTLQESGH